jgi:surface antigen
MSNYGAGATVTEEVIMSEAFSAGKRFFRKYDGTYKYDGRIRYNGNKLIPV